MQINLDKNNTKVCVAYISSNAEVTHNLDSSMDYEYEIKRKLMMLLVEKLFENGHIEFTKEIDTLNFGYVCRARIVSVDKYVIGELRKREVI